MFLQLLRSETAGSPDRLRAALEGLRRYQTAERQHRPAPRPIVAAAGRAVLRDYGRVGAPPVVFVPSLINPPDVLDLAEEQSMLRFMAEHGLRPLLLDWGAPRHDDHRFDVAGHVETMLLPLVDQLGLDVSIVGYCLGGTMALAAAARRRLVSLGLIATPWRFAGFPRSARDDLTALWEKAEPAARQLGVLPMEVLQASFWRLDPARTVAKFEAFAETDPASATAAAFVTLEDWANDGPPLSYAAGRELLKDMFGGDVTGEERWHVAGGAVRLADVTCPTLNIVSTRDRIVPAASAASVGERRDLDLGHVGMVVGGRARAALWEPLAAALLAAAGR